MTVRLFSLSLVAIASLCAAALGHSVVAALTRAGVVVSAFGAYRHEALTPVLLAAGIVALVVALGLFGDALARALGVRGDWVAALSAHMARTPVAKLAPAVLTLQLLVFFAMEAVEQNAAFGHPLGLMATLGTPVAFGLAAHLLATLVVLGGLRFATRAIAAAAAALARAIGPAIRRLLIDKQSPLRPAYYAYASFTDRSFYSPLARRIANRPPPITVL
ncbi:MAG TPA: hypothetical protein VN934_08970 [Candidatus Tumulicola sp.]|nr:hypothetical protein [Candidatus Tumulicola sp.]